MRNTSITTNGMLADTPDEKNPLSGWTFTHSCCSRPTAIAPAKASGQARHPADHDRGERADEQERELELVEADDRREQHAREPGQHHADHPRACGDRLGVDARDAGVARVVDGHARRQPERA